MCEFDVDKNRVGMLIKRLIIIKNKEINKAFNNKS